MAESNTSIRTLFDSAEKLRTALDTYANPNDTEFQDNISNAIVTYEECRKLADQLALFSPNETVDDISSGGLQYLLIDYRLAELMLRHNASNRKAVLGRSREAYKRYLDLIDKYDIFTKDQKKMHERYLDSPESFSTASTTDAGARRETKVARFKEEKELRRKLEYLQQNPSALQNDESTVRDVHLTNVELCTHETFSSLESIAQELQILAMAPSFPHTGPEALTPDHRERIGRPGLEYSDRLDPPISQLMATGKAGPILDKEGRPLKPFTLLDSRDRLRQGVFKSGHNLPTMTIDEYLEEEKRRGGIIEGGGEQSGIRPEPDEDNLEKADEETMKARAWDEFTEENPKGSGNTLNRG